MTDFDPEFDKLSDQPVTIVGGSKSAAAWHGPHSELISRLRQYADIASIYGPDGELVHEAADALEALTSPGKRRQHNRDVITQFVGGIPQRITTISGRGGLREYVAETLGDTN